MSSKIIASSALLALASLAHGLGSANVVNSCSYNVYLTNVPAETSGVAQVGPLTLPPGGSYSQTYQELPSAGGWSIKLAPSSSLAQVLQYEYSYPGTDTIFFDLSQINGDPWGGNWFFSGSSGCAPSQNAYTYSTDDQAAMQSCSDDASVTLNLCANSASSPSATTFVTSVTSAPTATNAAPPA